MSADLSESELQRYAAQIERIGIDAQLRLKGARAIVIGAGRGGSSAAAELVSRGVGYVAVADGAAVALGDLLGQALLYTPDVGANRAEALVAKLGLLNPHVHCESYPVDPDEQNSYAILAGHDVAVDTSEGLSDFLVQAGAEAGVEIVHVDGDACGAGIAAAGHAIEFLAAAEVAR